MPTRHERSSEKKFVKLTAGKTKIKYFKGKPKKHHCALCQGMLFGVPHSHKIHELAKLSKTQKRPTVVFGGVLCSNCRKKVFEETAKVSQNLKSIDEVSFKIKEFVQTAKQVMEK
ncbi:MAG: 50S ribosomal protein L34e [Candidatus Diapherotrites archaeon]|nr:50S ribosomal protein L34e [Candidatus Diapherotrites archaeon]